MRVEAGAPSITRTPDAPELLQLAISPRRVDVDADTRQVRLVAAATDDGSGPFWLSVTAADAGTGVARVIIFVGLPDFSSASGCLASSPAEGDRSSGTFRCSIPIAADAVTGEWKVLDVSIQDAVGNDLFLTTADLEAGGTR